LPTAVEKSLLHPQPTGRTIASTKSDESDRPNANQPGPLAVVAMVCFGAVLGLLIGYFGGAFLACEVLMPQSNLCGLVGAFITGPIGLVAGAVMAWKFRRARWW
jgi:hypothetical protein